MIDFLELLTGLAILTNTKNRKNSRQIQGCHYCLSDCYCICGYTDFNAFRGSTFFIGLRRLAFFGIIFQS